MFLQTKTSEKALPQDAPRTLYLIVHAKIFTFVDGWNQLSEDKGIFNFEKHAFNFDYLLHLSGINYLIHPEDVTQIIWMMQEGVHDLVEFNIRFVNRSGEMKSLSGLTRLVPKLS